jgi:hypothetical protein
VDDPRPDSDLVGWQDFLRHKERSQGGIGSADNFSTRLETVVSQ